MLRPKKLEIQEKKSENFERVDKKQMECHKIETN
jgi:hypothetical protein